MGKLSVSDKNLIFLIDLMKNKATSMFSWDFY